MCLRVSGDEKEMDLVGSGGRLGWRGRWYDWESGRERKRREESMCWRAGGDGGGGKCFWVVVREETDVEKREQVVGHERVRGRGGEVLSRGAVRLD